MVSRRLYNQNYVLYILLDGSDIYTEVNEFTKQKNRLNATSLNKDVTHALVEGTDKVSGKQRLKNNMITGKLEVYSDV